jgi:hypothetical protein
MHVGKRDKKGNWVPSKSEAMFFPKKDTTYRKPDPKTFSNLKTALSTPMNSNTLAVYSHPTYSMTQKSRRESNKPRPK